ALGRGPRDRFPSVDAFAAGLQASLAAPHYGAGPGDETIVAAPRRRRRPPRAPAERPSIWPLILLLSGLAVLAAIFAAAFALNGPQELKKALGVGKSHSSAGGPVHLSGLSGYDPFGTGGEHDPKA